MLKPIRRAGHILAHKVVVMNRPDMALKLRKALHAMSLRSRSKCNAFLFRCLNFAVSLKYNRPHVWFINSTFSIWEIIFRFYDFGNNFTNAIIFSACHCWALSTFFDKIVCIAKLNKHTGNDCLCWSKSFVAEVKVGFVFCCIIPKRCLNI